MDTDIDANEEKYREAFETTIGELTALLNERRELESMLVLIERRLDKLRHAALSLGEICGETIETINSRWPGLFPDNALENAGLTGAVREVLCDNRGQYLSPVHIRELLKEMGFDTGRYKNALASIHTVLKRLLAQKAVVDVTNEGKVLYKWNQEPEQE
jgi:predicted nuclease with TOPRIM domain